MKPYHLMSHFYTNYHLQMSGFHLLPLLIDPFTVLHYTAVLTSPNIYATSLHRTNLLLKVISL